MSKEMDEDEMLRLILTERKKISELEKKKNQAKRKENETEEELLPYLNFPSSFLKSLMEKDSHQQNNEKEEEIEPSSYATINTTDGKNKVEMLTETTIPKHCVPIRMDVRQMDWDALGKALQFDVILMDPPWQLANSNPIRGVAIGYKPLADKYIQAIKLSSVQSSGLIFIWVINAKYVKTLEMLENWGYEYLDEITWVKRTKHRRLAKGHGYYLQHAKENCIIGIKKDNNGNNGTNNNILEIAKQRLYSWKENNYCDVIFSDRRGQSQKPEELYNLIEYIVPNGNYLEIFGRRNNLRDYWVTIGNEL